MWDREGNDKKKSLGSLVGRLRWPMGGGVIAIKGFKEVSIFKGNGGRIGMFVRIGPRVRGGPSQGNNPKKLGATA